MVAPPRVGSGGVPSEHWGVPVTGANEYDWNVSSSSVHALLAGIATAAPLQSFDV